MFGLKTRRSGGVAVTAAVHRVLARGNAARDRGDWAGARAAYRGALQADPTLAHIWVQLGHAAKEAGDRAEAERAYTEAARLRPGDADPHLQLGHLFNRDGDWVRAAPHYLRAAQANPGLIDAATALHRSIARARGRARTDLLALLMAEVGREAPEAAEAAMDGEVTTPAAAGTGPAVTFDVSDLVLYVAHGRAPTGIQRVQIQVISHALLRPAGPVRLCCFIDGRDAWLEVPVRRFTALVRLSTQGSDRADPAWVAALNRLHLDLALAPEFAFPAGSLLVNLGSSWQLPNYFLFVRAARVRHGIRYVPFVHDLIPIVAPGHFLLAARREVVPWFLGVFTHADHVLVNSRSTRTDLLRVAADTGYPMDPDGVAVIPLDADFRTPGLRAVPPAGLDEPFVLLVSTVESRKGHRTALEAWSALIARHGAGRVPKLVCVGKRGWLSAAVFRMLDEDTVLAGRVEMRSGVSDEELAGLYAACRFTVYPSLYEGWGLPITEALSHGKPVIAAETSSLPEAGGEFAVYVPPGNAAALADAVERMAFDDGYRDGLAARITAGFRPRGWGALADQVQAELAWFAAGPPGAPAPPQARLNRWHSVARPSAARLWPGAGVGEVFRTGTGWTAPDPDGSRTRPGGGRLLIPLPHGSGPVRIGLLLLGQADAELDWQVQLRGGAFRSGTLARHARGWVLLDHDPAGRPLELLISSDAGESEADLEQAAGDGDPACVGLAGFFVHLVADGAAGERLVRAAALNSLGEVDAFRAPSPERPAVDWD